MLINFHNLTLQQPDEQLNPKKKIWEKIAVDLKTSNSHASDGSCQAQWQGNPLVITGKGKICISVA